MAHGTRNIQAGLAYHVTQRGSNQQPVFFEAGDHQRYLRFLKDNQKNASLKILAYCLMPNHVHLIVRPDFDDSLSVFFRRVSGSFARYINLKEGRSGHLWQGRYHACSLSERHLLRALRYVEHNPVRAGLAERPEKFAWSSAAAHLGAPDQAQILDLDFWRTEGGVEAWRSLLATPEELIEERVLRACTYAGRPFGDESLMKPESKPSRPEWQRKSFEEKPQTDHAAA